MLVEESLVLLLRDKFFMQELGMTYKNTITVKGAGDFLIKSEEDAMSAARKERIKPEFDSENDASGMDLEDTQA